ncbi:MAG TPA: WbqC family protein [Candidatus Hydrogenedentes bacterium]|nr:WbqC family protein [Candidatus Hydrogenedentota bacterium]
MSTITGIHQPHYLPWLRYFEKIARSDAFIVLDNIQFNKNGWQNRNKVKSSSGAVLLTAPVYEKYQQPLNEVRINNTVSWRRKHWLTIEQSYRKAPFFEAYAAFLNETYEREWEYLNALNRHMLEYFVCALGIRTRLYYASELNVPGEATERLVNLVHAVGGDVYYSGAFARDAYLDIEQLEKAGISLALQEWKAPVYTQLHGPFIADLSIIDLLMNCGPKSLSILLGGTHDSA